MIKINATNLYYYIINNLDELEKAKYDPNCTVIYDKYYIGGTDKPKELTPHVKVLVPSIATFLLNNLYQCWGEMVDLEKIKWWYKLSLASKTCRTSIFRLKYKSLIETLEKNYEKI